MSITFKFGFWLLLLDPIGYRIVDIDRLKFSYLFKFKFVLIYMLLDKYILIFIIKSQILLSILPLSSDYDELF